jgi:hypothetical protein
VLVDCFGAVAFATEPPDESALMREPYPKDRHLITATMARNIIGQVVFQSALLLVLLLKGDQLVEWGYLDVAVDPAARFTSSLPKADPLLPEVRIPIKCAPERNRRGIDRLID